MPVDRGWQTAAMTLIAIDGPTGVGKSTTARAVAAAMHADLVLDPVSVSPLLDDYYTGEATPAAALDVELAFLRSRAELLAVPADAENADLVVSDFSVMRTAPFSEFLADPSDRRTVLDEMYAAIAVGRRPDVLVLLTGRPADLLTRVRTRDRDAEVDLTIEHLEALHRHFADWQADMLQQARTAFVIDTDDWDPRNPDDLDRLVARLRTLRRRPA